VTVYVEDWQAAYGAPYLVRPEDQGAEQVDLVEDGGRLESHRPEIKAAFPIVFVDGVRRGEAALYQHCLLYTSPSPRDLSTSRMPSSA